MIWLILALPLMAFSDVSQRCRDFSEQIDRHLAEQTKLQVKNQELEEKLKSVLQQEITAQVEKRDSAEEMGAARDVYYELRKSRMESERWKKVIATLRTTHCGFCEKEAGDASQFCLRCPSSKTCPGRGTK